MTRSALLLVLGVVFAACDGGPTTIPPDPPEETVGLFDESPLLPALGDPGADDWQWASEPEMRCRLGAQTGFGLRRAEGSPDLVIYLQGGGACYDLGSCIVNPNVFGEGAFNGFAAGPGTAGLFARDREANPFRDWNVVFVPYCTGDFHAGDVRDRAVPGVVGTQDFVGLSNLDVVLDRVGDAAQGARQIVLTGESAGGLGTILTYGRVAERLAPAPVDLLDDSGPFLPSNAAMPPPRQQQWTSLWNLDTALPDDCESCRQPDGLEHVLPHYARSFPARRFGLVSYRQDFVIRLYYGYYGVISPQPFEDGLFGIRSTLPDNAGTYFVPGDGHTFLSSGAFFTTEVEGVALADWVGALVGGGVSDVPADR